MVRKRSCPEELKISEEAQYMPAVVAVEWIYAYQQYPTSMNGQHYV